MKAKTISDVNKKRYSVDFNDDLPKTTKHRYNLVYDVLAKEIGGRKGLRYADVGPRGKFLEQVKELGYDVKGIDISDDLIKSFKKKGIDVVKADLQEKIPLKDRTFDVISALEVIEHLVDTEFFVKEMKRLLKKDGLLILATPNIVSLGSRLRMLFGYLPLQYSFMYGMRFGHHVRLFNKGGLRKILERNGFEVEKLIGTEVYFNPNRWGDGWNSMLLGRLFPCLAQRLFIVARKK